LGETVPNGKLKGEARWERTKMTLRERQVGRPRREKHEKLLETGKNLVQVDRKIKKTKTVRRTDTGG
jgi:hypothetical protein